MLFILAIDPLHHILRRATETGTLQPLQDTSVRLRVSLYADDAAVFVGPATEDLKAITRILEVFGDATGLKTNLSKTEIFPRRLRTPRHVSRLDETPSHALTWAFPSTTPGLKQRTSNLL